MLEAADDRVASLCPIAGHDGAGCCDQAFVAPEALRRIKGEVVANQLQRLGGHDWQGWPNRWATARRRGGAAGSA